MADNVVADEGTGGATFATDDIGGVHYPITKLTFGALDSQTIASSNSGASDAGTLRVTLATDDTVTVDNGGTFAVQAAQSGTWTVDLGATDNAVLDSIAAGFAVEGRPLGVVYCFKGTTAPIERTSSWIQTDTSKSMSCPEVVGALSTTKTPRLQGPSPAQLRLWNGTTP